MPSTLPAAPQENVEIVTGSGRLPRRRSAARSRCSWPTRRLQYRLPGLRGNAECSAKAPEHVFRSGTPTRPAEPIHQERGAHRRCVLGDPAGRDRSGRHDHHETRQCRGDRNKSSSRPPERQADDADEEPCQQGREAVGELVEPVNPSSASRRAWGDDSQGARRPRRAWRSGVHPVDGKHEAVLRRRGPHLLRRAPRRPELRADRGGGNRLAFGRLRGGGGLRRPHPAPHRPGPMRSFQARRRPGARTPACSRAAPRECGRCSAPNVSRVPPDRFARCLCGITRVSNPGQIAEDPVTARCKELVGRQCRMSGTASSAAAFARAQREPDGVTRGRSRAS